MSEKSSYVGKIENAGTQKVTAPHQKAHPKQGKVKRGTDLRTGGGGVKR
jgi:hypothetical protein